MLSALRQDVSFTLRSVSRPLSRIEVLINVLWAFLVLSAAAHPARPVIYVHPQIDTVGWVN